MESVVLIIVAVGLVIAGIVYHASLPRTKFRKAAELISKKEYEDGRNILALLAGKLPDVPAKIAESFILEGLDQNDKNIAKGFFLRVFDIKSQISDEDTSKLYRPFEVQAIYEVAKIDLDSAKSERNASAVVSQVNGGLEFLSKAGTEYLLEQFTALKNDHFHELAKAHKTLGNEAERQGRIGEALTEYSAARKFASNTSDSVQDSEISVRVAICNLKQNQQFNQEIFSKIGGVESKIRSDFYFRYAKKLANNGNYAESEKIIKSNLDSRNVTVNKLLEYLREKKVEFATSKIERFNSVIANKETHSTQELRSLYLEFDETLHRIVEVIPSASEKVKQIKPSLFKRLLTDYVDQGLFADGLKIITNYPDFWNSPEILRNAAVCCFHIASEGLLTEVNFKEIISTWLTAVFCNDTILKSLELTTWDDEYTFSLQGAIGSLVAKANLASNINNDAPSEKNIAIGDTQRELIHKFEDILHHIPNAQFQSLILDFYSQEKEAIEKAIRIIDRNIFIAAPHFALSNNICDDIVKAIDDKYIITDNESVLEIGTHFIKTPNDTIVGNYLAATQVVANFLKNIDEENIPGLKVINSKGNKALLNQFPKFLSSIEDQIHRHIEKRITRNELNQNLIPLMEEAISFSARNEKLKFQYSGFVTSYCIDKVNAEQLENYKALSLLATAYFISPSNQKLCDTLITLIHFNLRDIKNEETTNSRNIYSLLDKINASKSYVFRELSPELLEIRERLLSQVEQAGLPRNLFTGQFNGNLNSAGLELKKVLVYYKKLGEN
jgi:uncharacterized protein YdbL (DUF1318 family)